MPTVPTYGGNQAAPSSAPAGNFTAPQELNAAPQQLQQLGQTVERAGSAAAGFAVDMQQQVNQVRVDDALNKARQRVLDLGYGQDGYKNLRGDAALTRPDGKALTDEYGSKLDETINTLSGQLGNDAQRLAFQQNANSLKGQFQAGVMEHANNEYRKYALSTQEGTIKLGADQAALDWQDPTKVQASLDSVRAAVIRTGTLQGWSGSETTARMNDIVSGVHSRVIDTAMQKDDPEYAMGYMAQHKDQMTAADLLRVRGVITKDVVQRGAETLASTVIAEIRQKAQPNDFGRMVQITVQSESGGRETAPGPKAPPPKDLNNMTAQQKKDFYAAAEAQFALQPGGPVLTSPKGAKGSMQVLDGTNRDPGYGVKPAADDSAAERARVGRDYLGAMIKEYNGDASKAWAAYNWGPKKLDAAIKEYGSNWLAHAPQETQAYVAKNMAALGSGGGSARPTLQEVHDNVRAATAAKYGATPPAGILKLALASATQQFEDMDKARRSTDDQHVVDAMQAIQQVDGKFSQLPYAIRSKIPADKVDQVISYGQKISKGDDITNKAVYLKLTDPVYLKSLSANQFYQLQTELSAADFQHFSNQRAAELGKATNKVEEINQTALNSSLNTYLRRLNMDPTPKDKTPEAEQLGAIQMSLKDTMLRQQKITGKQMTDAEVEKHVAEQFAKTSAFSTSMPGTGWFKSNSSQRLLTMKPDDIPDDTKAALKADFKAAGIPNPTDGDLLGAYLKLKSLPMKAPKPRDTAQSKTGTIKQ